jgi:hypothetical protein
MCPNLYTDNLREFGVQTTVIAAPLRWVGLLPAVLGPGPVGTHVAQTLRFSRFIAGPPAPLEFKAFWAQNRALAEVWRTCVLLTTVFIDWIGPRRSRAQKSALLWHFSRAHFGNVYKHRLKVEIVHSDLHL